MCYEAKETYTVQCTECFKYLLKLDLQPQLNMHSVDAFCRSLVQKKTVSSGFQAFVF